MVAVVAGATSGVVTATFIALVDLGAPHRDVMGVTINLP